MAAHHDRSGPDALELVRDFVNTKDIEAQTDGLETPAALRSWLVRHDVLDAGTASVEPRELAFALAVREALRDFLVANARGEPPAQDTIRLLNDASRQLRLFPRLAASGQSTIVADRTGTNQALGTLLATMHAEIACGRWKRLKACLNASCHWAFYDSSRNNSSHWCRMGVCGNRNKNRAYYARKRAEAPRTDLEN